MAGVGGGSRSLEESVKVEIGEVRERECRICQMGLKSDEYGIGIELGCSCKDDLAAAHIHCAQAWFNIKGNTRCEICHSIARNVNGVGAHEVEATESTDAASTATVAAASGGRSIWQGHRVLNFLLACMVFAFVISWLFHFNAPS